MDHGVGGKTWGAMFLFARRLFARLCQSPPLFNQTHGSQAALAVHSAAGHRQRHRSSHSIAIPASRKMEDDSGGRVWYGGACRNRQRIVADGLFLVHRVGLGRTSDLSGQLQGSGSLADLHGSVCDLPLGGGQNLAWRH